MVYVSTAPAELLRTQGQALYDPVYGTSLVYVSNTGSDRFRDNANNEYYVLIAGRWFVSHSLQNGPWTYVSGTSLPSGFAQIPPYSLKASVLVSVPGTPQAKEALIANEIPQTATITRSAAKLTVSYSGTPIFQPIEGTELTYAVNTSTPVINALEQHLLRGAGRRLVHVTECPGAVDRRHLGASSDLHHPTQLPHPLRHLRECLWLYAECGLCGLYPGLLRHGGRIGQRRGLRNGLVLSALRYCGRMDPGALHLRRWRRL
jgi:hypothetical protein